MSPRRPGSAATAWSSVVACSPSEMRWSRSARSALVPPGFLLRNVTVLDICPLMPSEVVDLQVELHTDPSPLFPGCPNGNQKGKGSSGRKERQQKDNFSDVCKLKWSNSKGGSFPGTACRDCRHLPHIQFKAQGWNPGTATLRRPLKVSIETRLLLYSSSIEAESDLSKTSVHIRDIRTVERVWNQKWWFESFVSYDGNYPGMDV